MHINDIKCCYLTVFIFKPELANFDNKEKSGKENFTEQPTVSLVCFHRTLVTPTACKCI